METHVGSPWNPGRYGAWATKDWVATKVRETYGMNNHVHFPNENLLAGRQCGGVILLGFSESTSWDLRRGLRTTKGFFSCWYVPFSICYPEVQKLCTRIGRVNISDGGKSLNLGKPTLKTGLWSQCPMKPFMHLGGRNPLEFTGTHMETKSPHDHVCFRIFPACLRFFFAYPTSIRSTFHAYPPEV